MSIAVANRDETDEAFARRLYQQELGRGNLDGTRTPLVANDHDGNRNPTIINARYNEMNNSRGNMIAVLAVNLPQVIAAIVVLSMYWDHSTVCDATHSTRWKLWSSFSAIRMAVYSAIVVIMFYWKPFFERHPNHFVQITGFRNIVDAMGLVWFIIGNLWLFGDDDSNSCPDPQRSPIYNLCFSMVIINYLQICLPCILAALLLPLFCFCMPCLIRILARYNRTTQGASQAAISSLDVISFTEEHLHSLGDDSTCPICLNEIALGNQVRVFRCKHIFHKECVDEWLTVNATCPTCRKSVFPLEGESLNGEGTTGNPANPATTVPSNTRGDQPHNDTVGSGVATEGPVHQSYLSVFGTSGGQNTATSVSARSSGSAEYNESTPLRANDESNTMTHDR